MKARSTRNACPDESTTQRRDVMKSFYVLYRNSLDYVTNNEYSNWDYQAESEEEVRNNFKDLGFAILAISENTGYELEQ